VKAPPWRVARGAGRSGPSIQALDSVDTNGDSKAVSQPIIGQRSQAFIQVAKEDGDTFLNVTTGLPVIQMKQLRTFFLFDIDGTMVRKRDRWL
jgi:hypothetical protein